MIVFLKNIPPETKKYEISSFINRVFSDCFLGKSSAKVSIEDIEILSIQVLDSNAIEKHGLVRIFSNEVGRRVIKRLDGTIFKQQRITIREYVNRSVLNDPRNTEFDAEVEFKERRTLDRRRSPLMNSWQKYPVLVNAVHTLVL